MATERHFEIRVSAATTYPWRVCGRVVTAVGHGSGAIVGPQHVLTASHVIDWTVTNGKIGAHMLLESSARKARCRQWSPGGILLKPQMSSSPFGFQSVKVIALSATDVARAKRFYSETLQLEEDHEATDEVGYRIGNSVLVIRQHPPTDDPNPRITLQVQDARETEKRLKDRAVTISDPVKLYEDKFWVGGFLDSEGNKIWFCSYA